MSDQPPHPYFVQFGDRNIQHNYYYGPPSHVEYSGLGHFSLMAGLASASTHPTLVNAVTEEMLRRATRPSSPIDDLLLCRRLAPVVANFGDWQLRRAFSRSLAHSLTSVSRNDDVVRQISHEFLDYARTSSNFSVMLSIASTASLPAALLFSDDVKGMYTFMHPQVLWQHSRNPSLSMAQGQLRPLIDSVLDREDSWIRRRLAGSFLLHASREERCDLGDITRLLTTLRGDDIRYVRLVLEWIDPLGLLDVPNALSPRFRRSLEKEQHPPNRVGLNLLPAADPSLIRTTLEEISLDLDMQKMSGIARDQLETDSSSKGRYSKIEDTIAYVMRSVPLESRGDLILELLGSFDEGIRWAVAAQFDLGLPKGRIGDREAGQILRLLADTHPWVIRESLTTMARADLALRESNLERLAVSAISALGRAQAQGWPRSELMPAIATLSASVPPFAEYIDLTAREQR